MSNADLSCTCDAFCDDPCPRHARENKSQAEVISLRAALVAEQEAHRNTRSAIEAIIRGANALRKDRDEAWATITALREVLLEVWDASSRGDEQGVSQDANLSLTLAICAAKTVTDLANPGASLLTELHSLREEVERLRATRAPAAEPGSNDG